MRGIRLPHRRDDEGERPFWISFADLMTALMVLFLVVMVVTIVRLNAADDQNAAAAAELQDIRADQREQQEEVAERTRREQLFWRRLTDATRTLGVGIDPQSGRIAFGPQAQFAKNRDALSAEGERLIRRFVSRLLQVADSADLQGVVGRVNVNGYASRSGSYLLNLDLSSRRSQRVFCVLLADGPAALPQARRRQVAQLFTVGGFSFGESKRTAAQSQRVEITVETFVGGQGQASDIPATASYGNCQLGG